MGFESWVELLFIVQSFFTVVILGILLLAGLFINEYDLVDVPLDCNLVDLPFLYWLVRIAAFWFYLNQGRLCKGVHAAWLSLVYRWVFDARRVELWKLPVFHFWLGQVHPDRLPYCMIRFSELTAHTWLLLLKLNNFNWLQQVIPVLHIHVQSLVYFSLIMVFA